MKKESTPPKKKKQTRKATDTATVEEAIRPYAIADKLRTLAPAPQHGAGAAGRTLRVFTRHAVAPRKRPTCADSADAYSLALVFGVGLDYFFTDPRKRHVVAISRREGTQNISIRSQIGLCLVVLRKPGLSCQ